MARDYNEGDLPSKTISESGRTWQRENYDTDSFQWIGTMEDDEYNWDPEEDNVNIVGGDTPMRIIELSPYSDGGWHVSASETGGPNYHRPGYTELISSDFSFKTDNFDTVIKKVHEFIRELS